MSCRTLFPAVACAVVAVFCGCRGIEAQSTPKTESGANMNAKQNMEKVYKFLKEAGTYYIATVEGDQPRVRPFGTIHIFDGKLYIQTGKRKNVSRQLAANGKVEICAMKGNEWLRVSGTLVNDDRREAKAAMLDAYPSLKKMYDPDDTNTQVLFFRNATATFNSFSHEPVVVKF